MVLSKILSGRRIIPLLAFLFSAWAFQAQGQQPPNVVGYGAEKLVKANDTLYILYNGSWISNTHRPALSGQVLTGLPLIKFAPRAFDKDLFVSKGYYPDYVLLNWELARFFNNVTFFRIYRKLLSAPDTDYAQVATVSKDVTSWKDDFAEASVMYEYKIKAEGLYGFEENFINTLEGVGFRLPSGSVSGRVTFSDEGGAPVKDVTIIAETADSFSSNSILLNGTSSYLAISPKLNSADWQFTNQFAFQAWVKPDPTALTRATLFQKGSQYSVEYEPGKIIFNANGSSLNLNFTQKSGEFFHVSAIRTAQDSLKIFVMYETDEIFKTSAYFAGLTTPSNNGMVNIGRSDAATQYFKGNIDEIRIWKSAPSDVSIKTESFRIIAGTEAGISAYYRLNEGTENFFYDLSREGFTFHEHHGSLFNTTWSSAIPTASQLAVKGITDSNGNYLITGIPYTSSGSLYTFTPAFGTHKFSPVQASRFLAPSSNTFSGVNFVDKSSFKVAGYVFYSGTQFPVSGVQVEVDGVTALSTSGTPVLTDGNGLFSVDVPIGEHRIQLVKQGHKFRNDGYFPSSTTYFDFQSDLTINANFFRDTTLVKVIGKVVGGPVQGEKPTGLERAKNNIGNATIVLEPQKPYDLKDVAGSINSTWNNEYYKSGVIENYATTAYSIQSVTPRKISINPDPVTGEFTAYLLPERYNVTDLSAGSYDKSKFGSLVGATWDLSNAFISKTELDSALVDPSDAKSGYAYDSVSYHVKQNLVLRVSPSVTVTSEDPAIARFWDDKIELDNATEIPIVSNNNFGSWLTSAPVFTQRKKYKALVSVFEEYVNADAGSITDKAPVVDGKVEIQNALAITTARQTFELNEKGQALYEFTGGVPNTATGGGTDYQKTMTVQVFSGKGGAITTSWPMGGPTFSGYVLGGRPVGNNFVTTGPNIVSMILRDPHGSGSFAFYETGTTNSTERSFELSNSEDTSQEVKFQMGADVTTQLGFPGATVETEVNIEADLAIGLNQSLSWTDNQTTVHTVTNTQRWSTSADPAFVGANGDLFIGNATNIVYGNSIFVQLIETANCDATAQCTGATLMLGGKSYRIGLQNAIRINPQFGTAFQYTQNHIENNLIPNLEFLRNEFLKKKNGTEYYSKYGVNEPLFGSANPTFTRSATGITGSSYDIIYPPGYGVGSSLEYIDSVAYYNRQIEGWKDLLARNEREKLESTLISNYSYDAGSTFESSTTIEESKSRTETYEFSVSPTLAESAGVTVNGVGLSMALSVTSTHRETKSSTTNQTTSQTFGYTLADSDEGDYYSIDVRDPGSHTGPVFKVKGGQSQCPYVDEELSKYYSKGSVLSAATIKREVPQIAVEKAIVTDVLNGKPANFKLFMSNASESGDDGWYQLSVDATSVTGGLVSIDGSAIGNGRVFFVPAGQTLTKILSISQVDQSITKFEDVKLVFHSICQFDLGASWPNIADTVAVSAFFQPSCSDVRIKSPDDLWLINTAKIQYFPNSNDVSSIPQTIGIEGYDLNHASFEKIDVQYKSTSSSLWLTDVTYYVDQTDFNAAPPPKAWINGAATLTRILEMKDLPDRNYEIRLRTGCADGTENFSEVRRGIKDVKRPQQFGSPQPGDGILSPGEDIQVTFDEPIEQSILTQFNFSVKGVLNGQPIDHNSVLFFDGIDDNASVIEGVNLVNKSFTVEFWARKLSDNINGVVYAQGNLELGFNSANQFYATIGAKTFVSTNTYTTASNWTHYAAVYDYTNDEIAFYVNDVIALNKTVVNETLNPTDRIYFGQSVAGKNFHGYLHDMRVWEAARGQGAIVANMSVTQTGDEIGLSGLWLMNEAGGTFAADLSRSHHAVLNGADWRVFPVGYAQNFGGAARVEVPAGTIPVSNQMDMTIEFWMKGGPQTNTVLFSNGRGTGEDATPPFANIWVVGADDNGKLYVLNNGTRLVVDRAVFDNSWHHVAIVLKRVANTTVYVDGNVEKFTDSRNVGGFTAAQFTLGARQYYSGGNYSYDQHFTGKLDEFRLWGLARTKDLINLDKNSGLTGTETGLLAYLPFEAFDLNQIPQPTLISNTNAGQLTGVNTNSTADNTDVPRVKLARPVQNVAHTWVVNNDKIILNITEDPAVIEKTVLEITVQNIEDLYQNRLASPITWTAFVNKNTVLWNEQVVNLEKKLYAELEFAAQILNLGGTEQTYQITNIPSWLEIDQPTGNLLPNSSKTLRMKVKASAQIGRYEHSLYLSSDFGFQEKFNINLKVYEQAPSWTVTPENFQYDMSIIGAIRINGILSTDPDDIIAAEYNGEIRGVAKPRYVPEYDVYMFFMDVYANEPNGESLTFKVWDADKGRVHLNVTPQIDFLNNTIVGSPSAPQEFTVSDEVLVTYNFKKGWNWLSFNVTSPKMASSQMLFTELAAANGDLIKTIDQFDQYSSGIGWAGGITGSGGFTASKGYKMRLTTEQTLNISGQQVEVTTVQIGLTPGWNWIGYPASSNLEINSALSNLNFTNGDFIKGQNGFALYDNRLGWLGSLKFLVPTSGYMLKVANAATLTFPEPATFNGRISGGSEDAVATAPWSLDPSNFANTMSAIVEVDLCGKPAKPGDFLGVFVNGECRGVVAMTYVKDMNKGLFFLTAYANVQEENMEFRYFNGTLKTSFALDGRLTFMGDQLGGSLNAPIKVSTSNQDNCEKGPELAEEARIYPNPFTMGVQIELPAKALGSARIKVTDMAGRLVEEFKPTEQIMYWESKLALEPGTYFFLVEWKGGFKAYKILKLK